MLGSATKTSFSRIKRLAILIRFSITFSLITNTKVLETPQTGFGWTQANFAPMA